MRKLTRILALVLCVCMLLPMAAQAARYSAEDYDIPDDWAHDALVFAVEHGLLFGSENHDLMAAQLMTRAQIAALVVRVMGATEAGDLSAFRDVPRDAWYYDSLAAAYTLGIFTGTSATTMSPNAPVLREQAMTVICRAFALRAEDPDACDSFADASSISPYARDAVSAMKELGIVGGYPDGTVRPTGSITRAEVAQLFFRLLTEIADTPDEIPQVGRVVYRGTKNLPAGGSLDGTLHLTSSLSGSVSLTDWTLEGLVLRCAALSQIGLYRIDTEKLAVNMNSSYVDTTGSITDLDLRGRYNLVRADVSTAVIAGIGNKLVGSADDVTLESGTSAVLEGSFGSIVLDSNCSLTLNGTAQAITVRGDNCTVSGTGYAETITLLGRHPRVSLSCGTKEECYDKGLEGLQISLTQQGVLTHQKESVKVSAAFSGGIFDGPGTENGQRSVNLTWYCDGVKKLEQTDFLLSEGAIASVELPYDIAGLTCANGAVSLRVTYLDETMLRSLTVSLDPSLQDYLSARSVVTTPYVPVTLAYNTTLYENISNGLKNAIRSIPKGTTLQLISTEKSDYAYVRCEDGTVGWVWYQNCRFSSENYTDSANDYSVKTKEGFVDLGGYSSDTEYLIWVSLKTQHVNVFRGRKSNWELIGSYLCATGSNQHPTPSTVCSITGYYDDWRYEKYHVINVTYMFDGYAFHSILLNYNGTVNNGTLGTPASHGCIRMSVADSQYINTLPVGTTVVIY